VAVKPTDFNKREKSGGEANRFYISSAVKRVDK
jgi:hypothetical protein